jgi:hypothetical protein
MAGGKLNIIAGDLSQKKEKHLLLNPIISHK